MLQQKFVKEATEDRLDSSKSYIHQSSQDLNAVRTLVYSFHVQYHLSIEASSGNEKVPPSTRLRSVLAPFRPHTPSTQIFIWPSATATQRCLGYGRNKDHFSQMKIMYIYMNMLLLLYILHIPVECVYLIQARGVNL